VRAFFTEALDATVSAGYLASTLLLPENDNNFLGYISNGLAGFARRTSGDQGYDPIGPGQIDRIRNRQDLDRLTGSAQANWRPAGWLRVTAVTGLDVLGRFDSKLFPVGAVLLGTDYEAGQRFSNRVRFGTYTGNVSGSATFRPFEALTSTTTAAYQYQRELTEGTYAGGYVLTAGSETLAGASTRFEVSEEYLDNRLAGGLLQQQFGWRDRLFLTGGLRADDNSAFGNNFGRAYFPSAQLSWVVSEEPFFPRVRGLTSLQLRSAYGQSGLRPGNRDAQVYFNASPVRSDSLEIAGVTLGGIGDPNLKPERSTEYEAGAVIAALENRISLDVTYYNKRSRDALVARRTAPSAGVTTSVFANLGAVRNSGVEMLLNTRPVDRGSAVWNLNFNYSNNRDELLDLGQDVSGRDLPPIIFGLDNAQRHVEGYPLGGYWGQRILGFRDSNNDGTTDEVTYSDSTEFLGRAQPSQLFSVNSDLTLFRIVRLSALVDYRGGHKLYNGSESFRCGVARCRGINDPRSAPAEQARAVATRRDGVISGYVEDASFVRLREVALSLNVPERYARRLGGRTVSFTFAGQNLGVWSDYSGVDPEVNGAGQSNFQTFDFLSQPPVRRFTTRLTVGF
jgi:outer membrane receptor protein involved in Fe transport